MWRQILSLTDSNNTSSVDYSVDKLLPVNTRKTKTEDKHQYWRGERNLVYDKVVAYTCYDNQLTQEVTKCASSHRRGTSPWR